jgi:hypothetical protein
MKPLGTQFLDPEEYTTNLENVKLDSLKEIRPTKVLYKWGNTYVVDSSKGSLHELKKDGQLADF